MNNEIELKPCPFCGGEAEMRGDDAPENWVNCVANCLPFGRNKERLAEHWNTRPIEAQPQAENARLRTLLEGAYTYLTITEEHHDYNFDKAVKLLEDIEAALQHNEVTK